MTFTLQILHCHSGMPQALRRGNGAVLTNAKSYCELLDSVFVRAAKAQVSAAIVAGQRRAAIAVLFRHFAHPIPRYEERKNPNDLLIV